MYVQTVMLVCMSLITQVYQLSVECKRERWESTIDSVQTRFQQYQSWREKLVSRMRGSNKCALDAMSSLMFCCCARPKQLGLDVIFDKLQKLKTHFH